MYLIRVVFWVSFVWFWLFFFFVSVSFFSLLCCVALFGLVGVSSISSAVVGAPRRPGAERPRRAQRPRRAAGGVWGPKKWRGEAGRSVLGLVTFGVF